MDDEDAYQIMPYKEIISLRKEIESLKNQFGDSSSKGLLDSMAALTKSMNSMLELFRTAAEEMKLEEKSEINLAKEIGPLTQKLDVLTEQNKTLAEGLVAISDMLKEQKDPAPVFRLSRKVPPMQPEGMKPYPQGPFGGPNPPPGPNPMPQMGPNPIGPGPMNPGPAPMRQPMRPPFGDFSQGPPPLTPPNQFPGPNFPMQQNFGMPNDDLAPPEMPATSESSKKKGKFLGFIKK